MEIECGLKTGIKAKPLFFILSGNIETVSCPCNVDHAKYLLRILVLLKFVRAASGIHTNAYIAYSYIVLSVFFFFLRG